MFMKIGRRRTIRLYCMILLIYVLGCQQSTILPQNLPKNDSEDEPSYKLDATAWSVTYKSCESETLPLLGNEQVHFENGLFAYNYKLSETSSEICYQVLGYNRIVRSFTNFGSKLTEESIIVPLAKRLSCKSKVSNEKPSDETIEVSGNNEQLKIDSEEFKGVAQIKGNSLCPTGTLYLKLEKKQK